MNAQEAQAFGALEERISEMASRLNERNARIAELEAELAQRDRRISELAARLQMMTGIVEMLRSAMIDDTIEAMEIITP